VACVDDVLQDFDDGKCMGAVLFTDGWNSALAGRIPTRQNDGSTPERNHCDKTGAQNGALFFSLMFVPSLSCMASNHRFRTCESSCQNTAGRVFSRSRGRVSARHSERHACPRRLTRAAVLLNLTEAPQQRVREDARQRSRSFHRVRTQHTTAAFSLHV
jgi:hypothetical protein